MHRSHNVHLSRKWKCNRTDKFIKWTRSHWLYCCCIINGSCDMKPRGGQEEWRSNRERDQWVLMNMPAPPCRNYTTSLRGQLTACITHNARRDTCSGRLLMKINIVCFRVSYTQNHFCVCLYSTSTQIQIMQLHMITSWNRSVMKQIQFQM